MKEKELIEEIVREIKKRIEKEINKNIKPKKIMVLGALQEEQIRVLNAMYEIIPFRESQKSEEWDAFLITNLPVSLMTELALGSFSSKEAAYILQALLHGKKVYCMENGIEYRSYKKDCYQALYRLYQQYEGAICQFGVQISSCAADITEENSVTFMKKADTESEKQKDFMKINREREDRKAFGNTGTENESENAFMKNAEYKDLKRLRLVQEADLIKARSQGFAGILLEQNAIITPLARDYIFNHKMTVRHTD